MSDSSCIFPACVRDKLFRTRDGDICLCLHEVWPSLLADLGLLGPAMLISRCEEMALVSISREVDFVPVPGSTEMLDLKSGLCLETLALGAVIAGQEVHTERLSFHFFDKLGRGIFKVLLAPGADLDGFSQVVRHYAKGPHPLDLRGVTSSRAKTHGAVLADEKVTFQHAWPSYDPAMGGNHLPGRKEVTWLDALRLTGRERAMFLTKVGLIKAILAARREQIRLRVTTWQESMHHEAFILPRRLDRCNRCLHLFDFESELHLFLEADLEIWIGIHGQKRTFAIHLFSAEAQRRGVIQCAGNNEQHMAWNQALTEAAGFTSHKN